jgi:8-oxo-dGTP pyrophosphatase MutT (NUDIX family)
MLALLVLRPALSRRLPLPRAMSAPAPPWPPGRETPKLLTLVMPRSGSRVLLGLKKRGFGAGYFNGFGGKVEPSDASVRAAAARELHEEAGLRADATDESSFRRRGTLTFHFDDQPRPWRVAVYEATAWAGEPAESDEMAPRWFEEADLPFGALDAALSPRQSKRRLTAHAAQNACGRTTCTGTRSSCAARRSGCGLRRAVNLRSLPPFAAALTARASAAAKGTFWFRDTTTLVTHHLEAVREEDVAADDAEA